jgi:hypothetical protein
MNERARLQQLSGRLAALVEVLRLDASSPWTSKFERDLALSRLLMQEGSSREDIIALSKSVTDVYQGMGSFNDYSPAIFDASTGRYTPTPGTEAFARLANEVFDAAVALREL